MVSPRGRAPPPPPSRSSTISPPRATMPAPPPPIRSSTLEPVTSQQTGNMASPHLRMSTIPVQPSFQSLDINIPEPPQTEAGKWTFPSQREFPPPPPFEKKLRRYPTGAETGSSIPIDLSHLRPT